MDLLHGLFNRTTAGIETQLGSLRRLEWRIKPRDVLDQAGPCPSVKSLRITGFANVQRRINEDLDESAGQQLTHSIAISAMNSVVDRRCGCMDQPRASSAIT